MLKNYLKIAIRNLWKHKTFTLTNILGLAVAFGATLLLSLTAFHELSYDQFHTHKTSLQQLYREVHRPNTIENATAFPMPFTPALKTEIPDIVHASRYGEFGSNILRYKDHEFQYNTVYVDPDFLDMFSFPLIEGDKKTALNTLAGIVLTEKVKNSIFGKEEAIGRTVEMKTDTAWKPFVVTAIAKDVPENSSLEFAALIRFENTPAYQGAKDDWDRNDHDVFVELSPQTSAASFGQKLKAFTHKYYAKQAKDLKTSGAAPDKEGEFVSLRSIPLTDLHFNSIASSAGINKFYPYLLLLIAAFILFIASVNFVNLSLGRAFTRAREIGMRKVLGARRQQILSQFWGEALLICVASLMLGILLAYTLLPGYKTLFNQSLSPGILRSPWFLGSIVLGFAAVSLLAGGYPAWVLSALNTSQTVKGKITVAKNYRLRNSLMVIQFVLSGLLIICTTIVWQQLNYLRTAPLGYNKQQVLSIPIGAHIDGQRALDLMRSRLASIPNILSVTGTDINMGRGRDNSSSSSAITFEYKGKQIQSNWLRVDYDYAKTLDIQLIKGRDFSRDYSMDSAAIVINEKMAALLGDKDPLKANIPLDASHLQVVGVVKDFHFKSLHREIAPLTMVIRREWPLAYIFVKVAPTDLPGSLNAVQKVWKTINPKAESEISFLDENTDKQYRKEARLSRIFISGALLTILISCMGLFAIVVLVMGQRTKEIGIRKVLGASVASIFSLVAREFLVLVGLAVLIASPIAGWLMNKWLQDFAYHIHISIWVFLFAAAVALLIALFTISFQALKTAWLNPVDNLKSE
ncbi:MAG TPA: FtsX-like permease family protein [Puia sp.]|jgi:ABC-type antimicrobial peptide transport system permease subunit|nr:FtsX-like permease family protein [Puia sp.]